MKLYELALPKNSYLSNVGDLFSRKSESLLWGFPLLDYSRRYLFHHVKCVETRDTVQQRIIEFMSSKRQWYHFLSTPVYCDDYDLSSLHPTEALRSDGETDPISLHDIGPDTVCMPSPLYAACSEGLVHTAQRLLENSSELDFEKNDPYGSPLSVACRRGHSDVARLLIQWGTKRDFFHHPCIALVPAIENNMTDIAELLLELRADPNGIDWVNRNQYQVTPPSDASLSHQLCRFG